MKSLTEWDRGSWLALVSFIISVIALVIPYILVYTTDTKGFVPFYPITVVMGIVAGGIAYFLKNWKLLLFAVIAGLSPLLVFFGAMIGAEILYVITGGRVALI